MNVFPPHRAASAGICVALLLSTLAAPDGVAAVVGVPRTADVIVVGGDIRSEDGRDSVAEALAIHAGHVVAVGTNAQIRALALKGARVIDPLSRECGIR
jgi:hypothetical protein